MSVTVAVSGPAPGKTSFVPGAGLAVAAEAMQAGEGESSDFAALMREATGAPVGDSEGLKPGKTASPPEGKKPKKDKVKGEGELPVQSQQQETAEAATAPLIAPASTPAPSADRSATGTDEGVKPASPTAVASAPRAPAQGEVAASGTKAMAHVDLAEAAPADLPALAEAATDTPQAQPASGKRRGDASPEAVPEPKVRAGQPEVADVTDATQTTKAPAAPRPSDKINRAASKDASPSRAEVVSPQGEPTPSRAGRQRTEEAAVASPSRGNSDAASQPVRAGEATALLAVARKADKRVSLAVDEGVPVSRVSDGKTEFPAKGTGAGQASAVAIAAVQSDPVAASRVSGVQPKIAPKQPDTRADGSSEGRDSSPVSRVDAPAISGTAASVAPPLPTASAVAGAASMGGVALSGALGQQVVDLGVSGRWIDDIAREIASVAANPGQGSFRIASASLGAVRVDIAPGKDGSDVLMTVDNEAARAALSTETDRLMQDARLASVRLGEVRVERASVPAEGARSDTGTSQQQQQSGGQGTSGHGQTAMGQGNGQGGQHSAARPDAGALMNQNNGGNSPKAPFIKSVLQDSGTLEQSAPDRGRSSDRARYA